MILTLLWSVMDRSKIALKSPTSLTLDKNVKLITDFYPKKILKIKTEFLEDPFVLPSLLENEKFILFRFLLQFLFLAFILFELLKNSKALSKLIEISKCDLPNNLFYNPYIYLDKVRENEEKNQISLFCTHYTLDIKESNFLVLTKNFPKYGLKAGMKGFVNQIICHQKVELIFVFDSNYSKNLNQKTLKSFDSYFVKEYVGASKNLTYFFEKNIKK